MKILFEDNGKPLIDVHDLGRTAFSASGEMPGGQGLEHKLETQNRFFGAIQGLVTSHKHGEIDMDRSSD